MPIQADKKLLDKNIKNKIVLVSGAGGVYWQNFVGKLYFQSQKLLILENNEYALYKIENMINSSKEDKGLSFIQVIPILGSVQNKEHLDNIFF